MYLYIYIRGLVFDEEIAGGKGEVLDSWFQA